MRHGGVETEKYRVAHEMSYHYHINPCDFFLWGFLKEKMFQRRPENVAQLRAHIVKLYRALSEDLCRKVVTNARVRLQEVVRQDGGHIEHVLR
jgi:hypothetical protein